MNTSRIEIDGLHGARPDREAVTGATDRVGNDDARDGAPTNGARKRGGRQQEQPTSYYGLPVIKEPVWEARDIAGYLFFGGLAGASSALAAGAHLTGRRTLARVAKATATTAVGVSLAALVHDLGRPERFVNMLRVIKPTSPMSIGSWMLAGYAPLTIVAAASDLTGVLTPVGTVATLGAAGLGCGVATYTGALVANTAIPAWHAGWSEMPLLFAASAAMAAGGAGMCAGSGPETSPARRLAIVAALAEVALEEVMVRRMPSVVSQSYHQGRAGTLLRLGKGLALVGAGMATLAGRRSRTASSIAGVALLGASALTRFGIFHAGVQSAKDPQQTVVPQRATAALDRPSTGVALGPN